MSPTSHAHGFMNRTERRKAGKKLQQFTPSKDSVKQRGRVEHQRGINWRARRNERREQREQELFESLAAGNEGPGDHSTAGNEDYCSEAHQLLVAATSSSFNPSDLQKQETWYSLHVALPGSILNNAQSAELRAYLAGQIARTCSIFCVEEVIIFDETARMRKSQVRSFLNGSWQGMERISEVNVECNFHMARILEYLECPQYLRKALFSIQAPLKFAGVLNPLDCPHHLRATDRSIPYREGIVLDRLVKEGRGPACDVGLSKELQLVSPIEGLKIGSRVTVKIEDSHSDIFSQPYDVVIGTSDKGTPLESAQFKRVNGSKILVVLGGLAGLEVALGADSSIPADTEASQFFEHYVNALPGQGSRTIRTEEALPITLAALKYNLLTSSVVGDA